jgi:hypothetical protein
MAATASPFSTKLGASPLQCSNIAGQATKKAVNLILRPGDTNHISMGPAFDSLKSYQRCSASGEARRP